MTSGSYFFLQSYDNTIDDVGKEIKLKEYGR